MTRVAGILLSICYAAGAASLQKDGEALFDQCEFKAAARVFERALASEPENAQLHFWLGRSYERMADVASPFSARRTARKAEFHLVAALRRDPRNREYMRELFDFYLDSPEWFDGGLTRARMVLERLGPNDEDSETLNRMLAQSRKAYGGREWAFGRPILRFSGAAGYLSPWK